MNAQKPIATLNNTVSTSYRASIVDPGLIIMYQKVMMWRGERGVSLWYMMRLEPPAWCYTE